jgi:hypothetical protein
MTIYYVEFDLEVDGKGVEQNEIQVSADSLGDEGTSPRDFAPRVRRQSPANRDSRSLQMERSSAPLTTPVLKTGTIAVPG